MTINQNQSFLPCMNYKQLQKFRQQVYELLNFAIDATFELMDWENPISKAVWQIKQVCKHLPLRPMILLEA